MDDRRICGSHLCHSRASSPCLRPGSIPGIRTLGGRADGELLRRVSEVLSQYNRDSHSSHPRICHRFDHHGGPLHGGAGQSRRRKDQGGLVASGKLYSGKNGARREGHSRRNGDSSSAHRRCERDSGGAGDKTGSPDPGRWSPAAGTEGQEKERRTGGLRVCS